MILITGAAGKTGRAVLGALARRGAETRVLVRRPKQADELLQKGAVESVIGDMTNAGSFLQAMKDVRAVYHICPNMHPQEREIGRLALEAAQAEKVEHFVYHSVLHPHTEKMPHHWQKMRVEEMIFESGLSYAILQPAPYMQNILAFREEIMEKGSYTVPYPPGTRLSLVDLTDVGEAVASILLDPGHEGAIYELVGTGVLTQAEIAAVIGKTLQREVVAAETDLKTWRRRAIETGLEGYALETLVKMFEYYAMYGLWGNSATLQRLLGREPRSLTDFVLTEFI
ncbi:MAG: NmrA/HSCARG family protein [Bacillota bacterium]|nr:NmrA/HSCARG family protein [Bacillota bacterium]